MARQEVRSGHDGGALRAYALVVLLCLTQNVGAALAAAVSQAPLIVAGRTIPKLTRTYTLSDPDIAGPVFASVRTGASFTVFASDGTPRKVGVFVDPHWSRILYAVEGQPLRGSQGYGTGPGRFAHPQHLDVSPGGNLFVADTDNGIVKMYAYSYFAVIARWDFVEQFTLPGGSDFSKAAQVLWDDGGTVSTESDDVFWVLDRGQRRIAAYRIAHDGNHYIYQPYVSISLDDIGGVLQPRLPTCMTKGRTSPSGLPNASVNTTSLYVYDASSDSFFVYDIPRIPGTITDANSGSLVTVTAAGNPYPNRSYSALCTDAWGNILGVSESASQLVKMTGLFQPILSMGTLGDGGLGQNQFHSPTGIALDKVRNPDGSAEIRPSGMVCELWGASSGVQGIRLNLAVTDITTTMSSGPQGLEFSWVSSDPAKTFLTVKSAATGAALKVLASGEVRAAGANVLGWDGRTESGAIVPPCQGIILELKVRSQYSVPESVTTVTSVFYKPRALYNLYVPTNVTGAKYRIDGQEFTGGTNAIAHPCSLCTTHVLECAPKQIVASESRCFDRWSNDASRRHAISLSRDSTVALFITSGPGPTEVLAGGAVVNEAFDCKSPYVFYGHGGLTKNADWDTFRTHGFVKFRFPRATGGQTRAQLGVSIPFVGYGATFETIGSTLTETTNLWEGISLSGGGSFDCDSCSIRNANVGITAGLANPARTLRLRRSYFQYNKINDVNVAVDSTGSPPVSLYKNRFYGASAVKLSVGGALIAPHASAVIDSNAFPSPAGGSGALNLVGAWSGHINRNSFHVTNSNTVGIQLERYTVPCGSDCTWNFGWPVFELHQNKFTMEGNNGRFALVAPKVDSPLMMNAENNDWGGAYNAVFNGLVILDLVDQSDRAQVDHQPFIIPSGGGGGGCPFVLSEGPDGFEVENSILGMSEVSGIRGAFVRDATELRHATWGEGPIRVRIAELESDVDEIDYAALVAIKVGEDESVGVDSEGRPVVLRRVLSADKSTRWTGRSQPFVSPIAPGDAYRGEPGDSLELRLEPSPGFVVVRGTRIGISMVPKPQEAPSAQGGPGGFTVRVSYDLEGKEWTTIPTVLPRENWTTLVLPTDVVQDRFPRVIRIIWHSRHTLGWAGLVESRAAEVTARAGLRAASHSAGYSALEALEGEDGKAVRILPGEHVELEFASPGRDSQARLILLSRGRYSRAASSSSPEVPAIAYLSQNRPNPFNPTTEIRFGLPSATRATVRVFGVNGRLVATILNGVLPAGHHTVRWEGKNSSNREVASGVYFYEIRAGAYKERRRMVLLR